MKKILLCLLAVLSLNAYSQIKRVVDLDFSTESFWLNNSSEYKAYRQKSPRPTATADFLSISNFQFGDLTFAFTKGALRYTQENNDFSLTVLQGGTMTISVPADSHIDKIEFLTAVVTDLDLAYGEPGTFDKDNKVWTSGNVGVKSVKFSNFTFSSYIWTMRVSYTEASVVLDATVTPSPTDIVQSFDKMELIYPTAQGGMTVQNAAGITISGDYADKSKGSVNTTLTPSASGSKVTLSLAEPIVHDGTFTIKVPACAFKDAEGYENYALETTVTVRENRATFVPETVDPENNSEIEVLTPPIILTFPTNIGHVDTGKRFRLFREGVEEPVAHLKAVYNKSNKKVVKFVVDTSASDTFTEEGTYTLTIDEKTVFNHNYGDPLYERYNPDITLTYVVTEIDPYKAEKELFVALQQEAQELYAKIGIVGYPIADDGTDPLKPWIDKTVPTTKEELDADNDALKKAIKAFYNCTAITMPVSQKWYTIASVNTENEEVALTCANGAVSLGGMDKAAAFQVESITSDGVVVLKLKAGKDAVGNMTYKYLHVLLATDDYDYTSSKNVTDEKKYVNNLSLAKFVLPSEGTDQEPVVGLFSIRGGLGNYKSGEHEGDKVGDAYAMVIHGTTPTIGTNFEDKDTLYFKNDSTSAFRFVETVEPSDEPVVPINPTASLSEVNLDTHSMTLTIGNVTKVTLKDVALVKILQDETQDVTTQITAPSIIDAIEGSDTQFTVHLDGLSTGIYKLVLPVGTFTYSDANVNEQEMAQTFIILENTGNFVYDYMPTVYPAVEDGIFVTDVSLNEFYLYAGKTIGLAANPEKQMNLANYDSYTKVLHTGHFEPLVDEELYDFVIAHPELNINIVVDTVYTDDIPTDTTYTCDHDVLKLKVDNPIVKGELRRGRYVWWCEAATFGDSNFGLWLNDHSFTGQCHVNQEKWYYDYRVDNEMPGVKLTPTMLEYAGDTLMLSVLNVKSATLKDDTKPYFLKNGEKVAFAGNILTKVVEKDDQGINTNLTDFYVNTNGLVAGAYSLVLPAGTFELESDEDDKTMKDIDMMADFTILKDPEELVYPEVVLFPHSLKAGEAMTLTILNVKSVTLNDDALVHFEENGQTVEFLDTILTKIGDCEFTVNTAGLAIGSYDLVLPVGTFAYVVEAGKAVIDTPMTSCFTITDDGTGITNIHIDVNSSDIFDLQGRHVESMDKKGVYIVNGKKVVKK